MNKYQKLFHKIVRDDMRNLILENLTYRQMRRVLQKGFKNSSYGEIKSYRNAFKDDYRKNLSDN